MGDPSDPAAAAGHGAGRPADRVGRRVLSEPGRPRVLRDPLRQPRRRAVHQDAGRRRGRRRRGRHGRCWAATAAERAVPARRHGRRRAGSARRARHRAGPRRGRLDGRHDRPGDRHRRARRACVTLTSIMSTTGDPDVGQPSPEVLPRADGAGRRPSARPTSPTASRAAGLIGSPEHFDEDARRRTGRRGPTTAASTRAGVGQPAAGHRRVAEPVRRPAPARRARRSSSTATDDPLVDPSGGERTAEVIPGAELMMLDGMGHDLPTVLLAAGHRGDHGPGRPLGRATA